MLVGIADGANWAMAADIVERSSKDAEDEDEEDQVSDSSEMGC